MCSGQAVVQMARSTKDGIEYAIKFYVSISGYNSEAEMYGQRVGVQVSGLAQFLPKVRTLMKTSPYHCISLDCIRMRIPQVPVAG